MWHYYLGPYQLQTVGGFASYVGLGGSALSFCSAEHDSQADGRDSYGLALHWTAEPVASLDYLYLGSGDCRELQPSNAVKLAWEKLTGYRPVGNYLSQWLASQLMFGSDPARQVAQAPLVPRRDGTLEVVLQDHGAVISRKFRFTAGDNYRNKLRALLHRNLNEIRQDALAGRLISPKTMQVDTTLHRKFAKALLEKYGCDWADLKPAAWDAEERPLEHETTIQDAFTNSNGTALSSHSAGGFSWNTSASGITIQSNQASSATSASRYGRAESDLSTDDVYARVTIKSYTDGAVNCQAGACTRYSSSTFTGYVARMIPYWSPDRLVLSRLDGAFDPSVDMASNNNCPITVGDVIQAVSDGSTHTAYLNGVSKTSTTDSSYSGGTRCGMFFYAGATTAVDDFEAGDWPIVASSAPYHAILQSQPQRRFARS